MAEHINFEPSQNICSSIKKQRKEAKDIIENHAPTHIGNQGAGTLVKGTLVRLDLQGQFNYDNKRYANLQIQLNKKSKDEVNDDSAKNRGESSENEKSEENVENDNSEVNETNSNLTADGVGRPSTTIAIVLMPSGVDISENTVHTAWNGSLDHQQKATIIITEGQLTPNAGEQKRSCCSII